MALFVLRKLIFQMRMHTNPVGLDVWFLVGPYCLLPYLMYANSEGSDKTAQMLRLTWAFTSRLCEKYHNLMSWLKYSSSPYHYHSNKIEPCHEKRDLNVVYFVIFRMCIHSHSIGPETWLFVWSFILFHMRHSMTKPTMWPVRPAKTQISLGIRPVWSESSLCAQWADPMFLHADVEDSDQTGRMSRLVWVFAGRTCHFVDFFVLWVIYYVSE